jgi:hypothetical protein
VPARKRARLPPETALGSSGAARARLVPRLAVDFVSGTSRSQAQVAMWRHIEVKMVEVSFVLRTYHATKHVVAREQARQE